MEGRGRIFPQPSSFKHAVLCCNKDGNPKNCISECADGRNKTYDEAVKICRDKDMRLCSNEDISVDKLCCGNSCNYDNNWAWVRDKGTLT